MGFFSAKGRSHLNYTVMIAGALLCFFFMAIGTASAATFKSVNGEVVIEAETYTRLGGTIGGTWFIDKKISGYTGTGYIESTTDDEGQTHRYDPKIIRAEYDIDFQETGKYHLHLRTYSVDHTTNGFFATMDGRQFDYGHKDGSYVTVGKRSKWFWYTKGSGPEHLVPRGPEYEVSIDITKRGVQTLAISRRDDDGSRVDKIWLTKHQSVPQKTGTLDLTDPSVFEVNEVPVSAPTFNPDGGVHPGSTVNVVVSCATEGATIRYTTDGSDPSESSPAVISGGEVVLSIPGTLKAKAWLDDSSSEITTASYTRQEISSYAVNLMFAGLGVGELSDGASGIVCDGTLSDACSASYTADDQVILAASPKPGSIFKGWGGDCAGASGSVCTLAMDGDKSVEANFILQGQANPVGDIDVVKLTLEERNLFMNIADGERQFPVGSPIEKVSFQNNTVMIDYRDGTSQTASVMDGERYTDDFINLVLLGARSEDETFSSLLELPSFEAKVNAAGDSALVYYPAVIPNSHISGILVGDLILLKLKPVGEPSIFFSYRENAADAIVDGDFWLTEHLQDTILLPDQTIEPGEAVDLYLAVEDNGLYDLESSSGVIVDPLALGVIQEDSTPPSSLSGTSATGSGSGGCFIGTLTDRLF